MNDFHPEYIKKAPLWKKVRLAMEGQQAIHDAGTDFLPMTSGMKKKDTKLKDSLYEAYKLRARFYPLIDGYIDTVIGLSTENDLVLEMTHDPKSVTKNGLSVDELTLQCLENVSSLGRHILVNDADDGKPYIVQYVAEALVDWATDDYDQFIWAKFEEVYDANEDITERDLQKRYREYLLVDNKWTVYVKDESGNYLSEPVEIALPVDEEGLQLCPITVLGSRNNKTDIDNIPALPIVECSIAAYQVSADYRQSLFGLGQPTPYITGVNNDDVERILESGMGVGALWAISDPTAKVGFLETSGANAKDFVVEINRELELGKEQALKVVNQTSNAETAQAVSIRTNAQRATVWTIFSSVSEGIKRALMILNKWQSFSDQVEFEIKAEFSQGDAEYNMLNALNSTVNAMNAPQSVIFQWMRDNKLTEKTDEELADEISMQTPQML